MLIGGIAGIAIGIVCLIFHRRITGFWNKNLQQKDTDLQRSVATMNGPMFVLGSVAMIIVGVYFILSALLS